MKIQLYTVIMTMAIGLQMSGYPQPAASAQTDSAAPQPAADETRDLETPPEILNFVDAFGACYQVEINPRVERHDYEPAAFFRDGMKLSYEGDARYTCRLGVDVSYHQGVIDWEKVKADGYDFAFLRIGYRGYGQSGSINLDKQFFRNIKNAQQAGLEVGVYFFAQAVNEQEAVEEAEFVLEQLKGYELQLPVVYDPESILHTKARTDNVTGEQFTKNTIVFCEKIKEAGYEPMIYSNMKWEAYQFDLEALSEYPIWYADYEPLPQTPYAFRFWQYTNEGSVNGIQGAVDLNIELIPVTPSLTGHV
ncbi:MAG: glycoside hydrolase family 25 protein [Roseburia sp.]|nr:glycoside hydrolase family 25 protein [Roseburia sp.]